MLGEGFKIGVSDPNGFLRVCGISPYISKINKNRAISFFGVSRTRAE